MQLSNLFKATQKRVVELLLEQSSRTRQTANGTRDIYNGELYDKLSNILSSAAYQIQGITSLVQNPHPEKSLLSQAAFALESIAHLQGHERELLPFAIHLRQVEDKLREARKLGESLRDDYTEPGVSRDGEKLLALLDEILR